MSKGKASANLISEQNWKGSLRCKAFWLAFDLAGYRVKRNTEQIFLTRANNDPCNLGQHALIASLICGKMWKGTLRCVVFWPAFDLLKAAGSKRKPERLYIPGNFHQKRKNVNVLSLMWHDLLDQIKIQMQGETRGYVRARIWAEYWTFMLQKNSKYTFVMDHFDSLWWRLFKRHFGCAKWCHYELII